MTFVLFANNTNYRFHWDNRGICGPKQESVFDLFELLVDRGLFLAGDQYHTMDFFLERIIPVGTERLRVWVVIPGIIQHTGIERTIANIVLDP